MFTPLTLFPWRQRHPGHSRDVSPARHRRACGLWNAPPGPVAPPPTERCASAGAVRSWRPRRPARTWRSCRPVPAGSSAGTVPATPPRTPCHRRNVFPYYCAVGSRNFVYGIIRFLACTRAATRGLHLLPVGLDRSHIAAQEPPPPAPATRTTRREPVPPAEP